MSLHPIGALIVFLPPLLSSANWIPGAVGSLYQLEARSLFLRGRRTIKTKSSLGCVRKGKGALREGEKEEHREGVRKENPGKERRCEHPERERGK